MGSLFRRLSMSGYCKTCSEELFGKDFGDFAGLISKELVESGHGCVVLCEGCGPIFVNDLGEKL